MSEKRLTIIFGGNLDKDLKVVFANPKKGLGGPRNCVYFDSWKDFSKLLSKKGRLVLEEPKYLEGE